MLILKAPCATPISPLGGTPLRDHLDTTSILTQPGEAGIRDHQGSYGVSPVSVVEGTVENADRMGSGVPILQYEAVIWLDKQLMEWSKVTRLLNRGHYYQCLFFFRSKNVARDANGSRSRAQSPTGS